MNRNYSWMRYEKLKNIRNQGFDPLYQVHETEIRGEAHFPKKSGQ